MTMEEARVIAMLRAHFKCQPSEIYRLCCSLWGSRRVRESIGIAQAGNFDCGRELVTAMESMMGLVHSERMEIQQRSCQECGDVQWHVSLEFDKPERCHRCGALAACIMDD